MLVIRDSWRKRRSQMSMKGQREECERCFALDHVQPAQRSSSRDLTKLQVDLEMQKVGEWLAQM